MWRLFALVTTLITWLAWIGLCLGHQPKAIETSLSLAAGQALATAGLSGTSVRFDGRDAQLSGTVATAETVTQAASLLQAIPGVRSIDNLLTVAPTPAPEPALPYLEIHARAGSLVLRGSLPSESRLRELRRQALERFGAERVDDRVSVDSAAEDGAAMARAVDLLAVAGLVVADETPTAEGSDLVIRLRRNSLRLSGRVANAALRQRIEILARSAAPDVRVFFSTLQDPDTGAAGKPPEPSEP
ncbi:MAG: BON domain-containing protein [Acidobacteriota bacterium]